MFIIVTLVPAEQERKRPKLRHLDFDAYPSRTFAGLWFTLVATHATMHMIIIQDITNISV